MPDEKSASAVEGEEQASDASGAKPPKTFARRANSNLRVARRSLEEVDWQSDERARHLVAEANVFALLDLADAIRGTKPEA